ncbi:hypothetical protein QUF76_06440 [Desulfobacterales bacterium HSG16]|nr:hypothetical protein [Desulfobacterales bacterium HSG16]
MIDTDSVEYVGSHGTTVTKYLDIKKNGFRLGSGVRGKGIYFWENNVYAKDLAFAWYVTATRQKDSPYRNDQKKECAIIWAILDADKDEIIDFNSKIYRDQILNLIKNLKCDDNREGAYKLYDTCIDMIEAELGYKIKFIITEVYPPTGKLRIFPTQMYGMAPCLVAREPSCINLLSCDIIKQFNVYDNIAVNQVLEEIKNETQPKSA